MNNELSLARIILEYVEDPNEQIRVDLILREGQPKKGIEYFGLWLDRDEKIRSPFVLGTNGELDFGNGYKDEKDQYYTSNLLAKKYSLGEMVTLECDGVEYVFKVTGITPLI